MKTETFVIFVVKSQIRFLKNLQRVFCFYFVISRTKIIIGIHGWPNELAFLEGIYNTIKASYRFFRYEVKESLLDDKI